MCRPWQLHGSCTEATDVRAPVSVLVSLVLRRHADLPKAKVPNFHQHAKTLAQQQMHASVAPKTIKKISTHEAKACTQTVVCTQLGLTCNVAYVQLQHNFWPLNETAHIAANEMHLLTAEVSSSSSAPEALVVVELIFVAFEAAAPRPNVVSAVWSDAAVVAAANAVFVAFFLVCVTFAVALTNQLAGAINVAASASTTAG